jgi:uncharacterized protein (TIGR02145 family)
VETRDHGKKREKLIIMKAKFYLLLMLILSLTILSSCKKKDSTPAPEPPIPSDEIVFNPNLTYGTMTDIDGNVYKTIKIGDNTWMAENLKTTRYRNGVALNMNFNDASNAWGNTGQCGEGCSYNDDDSYLRLYGRLYNFYAVIDSVNILAPVGWHIPTSDEWYSLLTYNSNDDSYSGANNLRETGTTHWTAGGGNNSLGLSILPGGDFSYHGWVPGYSYRGMGTNSAYWMLYRPFNNNSHIRGDNIFIGSSDIAYIDQVDNSWFCSSVRCVKD